MALMAQLPQDSTAWQYKCESCVINIKLQYCSSCGSEISTEAICIKYYFKEGYEYEIILSFLAKFHDIKISLRTLKKRLTFLPVFGIACHQENCRLSARFEQR